MTTPEARPPLDLRELADEAIEYGYPVMDVEPLRMLRLLRIEAAARDAMEWMEAEGSHPRPDPRPAMLRQADLLRAALDEESQP